MIDDQHEPTDRATGERPKRGGRLPKLCWFPFCEGAAVGSAVIVCRDQRATVQACEVHAVRTIAANFTATNQRGTRCRTTGS